MLTSVQLRAAPAMIEKGEGAIINVASIAGTMGPGAGETNTAAYSASKAAMIAWSQSVHNVSCCLHVPSFVLPVSAHMQKLAGVARTTEDVWSSLQ